MGDRDTDIPTARVTDLTTADVMAFVILRTTTALLERRGETMLEMLFVNVFSSNGTSAVAAPLAIAEERGCLMMSSAWRLSLAAITSFIIVSKLWVKDSSS
mmetsp:Transcript_11156/g.20476  ORF Transcript_11156/g.20476 Transcript_11156/m.20476 type:complete len:101 (+) Transcript_11156:353-655(+)